MEARSWCVDARMEVAGDDVKRVGAGMPEAGCEVDMMLRMDLGVPELSAAKAGDRGADDAASEGDEEAYEPAKVCSVGSTRTEMS